MLKKISNISISVKLIGYLILACILPLLFLGLVSYSNSKVIITNEIDKSSLQAMESQKKYLEVILGEVDALIQNLSSIEDIKLVLAEKDGNNDDYGRLATQAKIGEILSGFTNLNGLVSIDI